MVSKPIISVSGLRGIVGDSLNPKVIQAYTAAYVQFLDDSNTPGPIVLGRDGRDSGQLIAQQIQTVLQALGRNVLYGNILATPTVGIQIKQQQAAGGIQITASHNPQPYNGMKLYSHQGRILSQTQSDQVLQNYHVTSPPRVTDQPSTARCTELRDPHAEHLRALLALADIQAIRQCGFKVLLDSNHGAGSLLGTRLLRDLNCQLTLLGETPDGQFSHLPEPVAENLETVTQHVARGSCDIGFCQDPDADRLAVIDERGNYIGEEYTIALCVEQRLATAAGDIVVNCASSSMSHQIAGKHQCDCHESAVGEANVVDKMIQTDAIFGGEGNGGPIDPQVGLIRDSFVGMVHILDLMASRRQSISEIVSGLPICSIHKTTIPVTNPDMQRTLEALSEQFPTAESQWIDGLKLRWPDGSWLLIRPSNTEPLVRAIAEAPTSDQARALCEQAIQLLD